MTGTFCSADSPPSCITAPLPNCFSIAATAAPIALSFSEILLIASPFKRFPPWVFPRVASSNPHAWSVASAARERAPRRRVCISDLHPFDGSRLELVRALGIGVRAQFRGLEQLGEVTLLPASAVRGLGGEPPLSIEHPAVDCQLHVAILDQKGWLS